MIINLHESNVYVLMERIELLYNTRKEVRLSVYRKQIYRSITRYVNKFRKGQQKARH